MMHPLIRRADTCKAQALLRNHGYQPFTYIMIGTDWCMITCDDEQLVLLTTHALVV
jgi:hypothetical protein